MYIHVCSVHAFSRHDFKYIYFTYMLVYQRRAYKPRYKLFKYHTHEGEIHITPS